MRGQYKPGDRGGNGVGEEGFKEVVCRGRVRGGVRSRLEEFEFARSVAGFLGLDEVKPSIFKGGEDGVRSLGFGETVTRLNNALIMIRASRKPVLMEEMGHSSIATGFVDYQEKLRRGELK